MESRHFDTLTRSLASTHSRRTALRAGGLALSAGLAGSSSLRVRAQDATPDPLADDATFLFVQSASSGTFAANPGAGTPTAEGTPTPGGGADYLLTLEGHTGNTVYFSDRPERIFGEAPTQRFLDGLGFSPANPPNAALVTNDADGNEDILVVELLNPVYDAGVGSVTYGVNILNDYEGGLDFVAGRQRDADLAPTFGEASLFIDDCPDVSGCLTSDGVIGDPSYYIGPLPAGTPSGQCWHWDSLTCKPCSGLGQSDYDSICNAAYAECDNHCFVYLGD